MALYTFTSEDEFNKLNRLPSRAQTEMYNTLSPNTNTGSGNDNFFTKRWKSIDNAIGTTGAALYESGGNLLGAALAGLTGGDYTSAVSARQNAKTDQLLKDNKEKMNNIYKKYGYDNAQAYYDAKKSAQDEVFSRYGFNDEDFRNKRAEADLAGDSARVAELEKERQDVISRMNSEDADKVNYFENIQNELKNQSRANVDAVNKDAADYRDYVENNDVSKRINQDRGKFLGSAINTLSTATDLLGLTNGPIANAIQGGIEGVADELEQNGLNNFDWNRAGQNALVGAASGAATGMLNNAIDSRLAGKGGNLFKGNNALTNGINNFNQNTGLGRLASTLGTGMARGAQSGAVGGAVGAGLSSAMNGAEVGQGIANALQGAVQGAGQGAVAGGAMAGANMVINKTPGINRFMQDVNEAKQNWQNSGDNFAERLNNTRANNDTWGNRFLNNRIEDARAVKQGFKDVGEGLGVLAERGMDKLRNMSAPVSNQRLAYAGAQGENVGGDYANYTNNKNANYSIIKGAAPDGSDLVKIDNSIFDGVPDDSASKVQALKSYLRDNMRGKELPLNNGEDGVAYIGNRGINKITKPGTIDTRGKVAGNLDEVLQVSKVNPNEPISADEKGRNFAKDGFEYRESYVDVDGDVYKVRSNIALDDGKKTFYTLNRYADNKNIPDQLGKSSVESLRDVSDSILPQTQSEVKVAPQEMPQDIQNMRVVNNTDSPETAVYRALTGNTEPSDTGLMYGESDLGNRTRRGMLADSLERFGNTLEGAQTNVTRAAAKDLGIESTGKVVENVRKKTGLTNLETQAALAKELTGSENALMDSVQRMALGTGEDGQPYKVNTDPVTKEVESIVDKYADTNMFGSQTAKDRFISNLRRDISNYDSDILSIANRMKSNAADLRGKGVTSPNPTDAAKAKIYTEIAGKLDDLSYKAIPQDNVDAMFDATISEMRGRAKQATDNGNTDIAKAYNKLADSLDAEPRTIQAFRSFKKDFVDVSKVNELTARAENGAATQMGRDLGGSIRRLGGTLLQRPVNAALAKAGGAINNLADKVAGEPTPTTSGTTAQAATSAGYNPATQVYNAIGRTEGAINADNTRAAGYISEAAQGANTLEDLAAPANTTSSTSVYNSVYGNSNGSTPKFASREEERAVYFFPPTGNARADMLSRALRRANNAEDYGAMDTLYSMYLDAVEKQEKNIASQTKLTDKQRQANAAQRALDDFEGVESNFAYDVSDIPILGAIANLGGNEYASKAEALALQIGYMLSGATVNKEEAKNIGMAYVPQPRDSEAVRQSKLRQLRGIIADYQQTYGE